MQEKKINLEEDLSKEDLEDMKNIFTQDDNEILDIPSMINIVHTQEKIDTPSTNEVEYQMLAKANNTCIGISATRSITYKPK